jgi:hypothetical protein
MLEEGYRFVEKSQKKDWVWELLCPQPNHTHGNWAIAQLCSILSMSLFGIIP